MTLRCTKIAALSTGCQRRLRTRFGADAGAKERGASIAPPLGGVLRNVSTPRVNKPPQSVEIKRFFVSTNYPGGGLLTRGADQTAARLEMPDADPNTHVNKLLKLLETSRSACQQNRTHGTRIDTGIKQSKPSRSTQPWNTASTSPPTRGSRLRQEPRPEARLPCVTCSPTRTSTAST